MKIKNILSKLYYFSGTWTGAITIVLLLLFFGVQSFVIPSGSMKRTQYQGDFLFAKKFSYGISTPELPWVGIKILPDFNHNGHLIEGPRPKREDIVIFYYPVNEKDHFVKRCVAVGGDEILYQDKKLMIHFHEGDEYIQSHYPNAKTVEINGKLWAINPYMDKYPGIQYAPEGMPAFSRMEYALRHREGLAVKPVSIEIDGKQQNAYYTKVEPDHFFMMGDNRDNSNDSRYWGGVPYRLIIGQPWFVWFSIEFRSYENVLRTAHDHQSLSRICGSLPLESQECKDAWNNYRYSFRWSRMFRTVKDIQIEEPTVD